MSTKRTARPRRVKAERTAAGWGRASTVPEWHLPATAAAYDAMVEQMAAAIGTHSYKRCRWSEIPEISKPYYRNEARWALRSLGITRPKDYWPKAT